MMVRAPTVGMLATMLAATLAVAGEGWLNDWQAAKAAASSNGRAILVNFTGSDWCGWCVRLTKEVFSQKEFADYAAENLVLMEVDFPREKTLPAEVQKQNQQLQEQFGVSGYPTLFLVDGQGLPLAQTGYRPGGAAAFVTHLKQQAAVRAARDEGFAKAKEAQGGERARLLAGALEPVAVELLGFYAEAIDEIRRLDPDNQTGFRARLAEMDLGKLEQQVLGLCRQGKGPEAAAAVDASVTERGLTGELKQKALLIKLNTCPAQTHAGLDAAEALVRDVVAVDPDTEVARRCAAIRERIAELRKQLPAREAAKGGAQ